MKKEQILELFARFEAATSRIEAVVCRSAGEFQLLLGYSKGENFENVIDKTKEACITHRK